ncbi:MAG: pyridoxamine 5'-phosphate oxidase family protein [Bacteroidota bacterium]|nr:pyridoxamine 5'-phosphate oxidase family protein [Bacteroidota bacterium]
MQEYHLKNRPNREIKADSEINDILQRGKFAVISMCRNNEPYIVSLSYGFDAEKKSLYVHCAPQGLKIDFFHSNPRICATIIEDGGYVIDECAHNYKTVVFWGNICFVTDLEEKKHGMKILLNHLENNRNLIQEKLSKSDDYYSNMEVLRIDIKQIHAKAGR